MSSVERRIIIEEYVSGGWGCPQLDLIGYKEYITQLGGENETIYKRIKGFT